MVDGLLAGSSSAISDFLERTHHPVFCLACRLTLDPELRQDWTHEVLLGVLDDVKRGRFVWRRPGSFWAWFRKRAYYRLLDEYRRHRRRSRREIQPGDDGENDGTWEFPGGEDPVAEIERAETLAAVEACLDKLPNADQQRALGLLLFNDLAYEAIAEIMAAPLNTVRAWIRRGRLALRKCVAGALGLATGGGPDA
jgi:RNA polymerase sigma-70 factor (ECF subfamily)